MKIILNFNGQKKWQSQGFNFKEAKSIFYIHMSLYTCLHSFIHLMDEHKTEALYISYSSLTCTMKYPSCEY